MSASALIPERRPDWSPVEVASPFKNAARTYDFKPRGSDARDPDDVGGCMPGVSTTIRAPLVMNENVATMLAATFARGFKVRSRIHTHLTMG